MAAIFRAAARDSAVAAFVLTGAGGNFCSGGDVHEIIGPLLERDTRGLMEFTALTGELVKAMRACPQPIIAAVDGVAAGAGAILAMAADLRLAAPRATVAFLFNRVGLAGCDMGACAILPRIIGQGRASELLYTGRSMSAEEGLAWGFFNRVSDPVLEVSLETAKDLASGPTAAPAPTIASGIGSSQGTSSRRSSGSPAVLPGWPRPVGSGRRSLPSSAVRHTLVAIR